MSEFVELVFFVFVTHSSWCILSLVAFHTSSSVVVPALSLWSLAASWMETMLNSEQLKRAIRSVADYFHQQAQREQTEPTPPDTSLNG